MENKKLLKTVTAISCLTLFATGCGKSAKLKNGEEKAVSLKNISITANNYYDEIKENNISKLVNMIDHKLFDNKYKLTDEEKKQIDSQISQIKTYYKTDDEFTTVIQQYFGVSSEKELRKELALDYKRKQAVKEYIEKNISNNEIKKYYESNISGQIKASHILIKSTATSDASDKEKADKKALKKAKDIINKLNNGEKFKNLAKKYSDDTATAANGGDLGYFSDEDMVEEFTKAVKELKNNEYTKEPVKTQYGYHIILRVNEKDKPKLKDVKKEIKEKILEEKISDQTIYYKTLVKIREKNKIKFSDSKLKDAYSKTMDNLIKQSEDAKNQSE